MTTIYLGTSVLKSNSKGMGEPGTTHGKYIGNVRTARLIVQHFAEIPAHYEADDDFEPHYDLIIEGMGEVVSFGFNETFADPMAEALKIVGRRVGWTTDRDAAVKIATANAAAREAARLAKRAGK